MKKGRIATLLLSLTMSVLLGTSAGASTAANGHANNGSSSASQTQKSNGNAAQNNKTSSQSTASTGSDHSQGTAGTSGSYNQPQPYSTADQNNTGANDTSDTNQYRSTRDGSPSMNGNGGGQATGKPCAGCVGKADNKNPKGQYPNGSDHNSGYECDGNHGIGRSNPAHTGCKTTIIGCTSNCGGHGGGCTSNCSSTDTCKTNCSTTTDYPKDKEKPVTGGRGGGEIAAAVSSLMASAAPTNLPFTGQANGTNGWGYIALLLSLFSIIYWRELIVPKLRNGGLV